MPDENNKPWLRIHIGARGQSYGSVICFVRANKKFVKPVKVKGSVADQALPVAVISDPDGYVKVRSGGSVKSSKTDTIRDGEHFLILSGKGDWRKVLTLAGKQGYVHKSGIKIQRNDATGAATVVDEDGYANVRTGPSTRKPVTGKVRSGERVIILTPKLETYQGVNEPIGPWMMIMTIDSKTSYVHSTKLRWIPLKKE